MTSANYDAAMVRVFADEGGYLERYWLARTPDHIAIGSYINGGNGLSVACLGSADFALVTPTDPRLSLIRRLGVAESSELVAKNFEPIRIAKFLFQPSFTKLWEQGSKFLIFQHM